MSDSEKLAAFLDSLPAGTRLRVEDDLGDGFVRLRVSEAERRQAGRTFAASKMRLSKCSAMRVMPTPNDYRGNVALGLSASHCRADDGDGVPKRLRDRIFEPRVTSKLNSMIMDDWGVHGRGMALYSIRENAARAECIALRRRQRAASSSSSSIVRKRLRKSDQSTPPSSLVKQSDGTWAVGSGPHNILMRIGIRACQSRRVHNVSRQPHRLRCDDAHLAASSLARPILRKPLRPSNVLALCATLPLWSMALRPWHRYVYAQRAPHSCRGK